MAPHCVTYARKRRHALTLRDHRARTAARQDAGLLPGLQRKMSPPILLITGLRMFIAGRPLFPVRHHRQTIRAHTEFHQVVPNGFRPFLTEYKVIGGRSTLVTVAFDLDERARIRLHPFSIPSERLASVLGNRPAIVTE